VSQESDTSGATDPTAAGESSSAGRFGEYVIERRLGAGGMGAVYLAHREADGEAVALKVLNPVAGANAEMVKRFIREAQVLLTLEHPGIVKAHDLGAVNGQHFIAMEYVPGENLGDIIKREGRIAPRQALEIMRQIANALSYGWKHRVVHRDLKPENFLISPDGTCKLADLGLAVLAGREDLRVTAPGTIMGTPAYMSPEQARGEHEVDTRSDVYSLGCAIYHAICGQPPFEGPSAVAILTKHLREEPPRPSRFVEGLMPGVEDIVLKCVLKEPAERYQTCSALVEAIDGLLRSDAAESAPDSSAKSAPPPSRRRRFDENSNEDSENAMPPAGVPAGQAAAKPGPDDALALLTARARAAAPAASSWQPVSGREHPSARTNSQTTRGPQGQRKTRTTIHMAGSRRGKLPFLPLAIAACGALFALTAAILYLYFTST